MRGKATLIPKLKYNMYYLWSNWIQDSLQWHFGNALNWYYALGDATKNFVGQVLQTTCNVHWGFTEPSTSTGWRFCREGRAVANLNKACMLGQQSQSLPDNCTPPVILPCRNLQNFHLAGQTGFSLEPRRIRAIEVWHHWCDLFRPPGISPKITHTAISQWHGIFTCHYRPARSQLLPSLASRYPTYSFDTPIITIIR